MIRHRERGNLLLVVVFLAAAIAGLAAIQSGRVVSETKRQAVLEQETRAFNSAYAQIHMAMNVINTSPYNDENQNVALRDAVDGLFGGTVKGLVEAAASDVGGLLSGATSALRGATSGDTGGVTSGVAAAVGTLAGGETSGYLRDATSDIGKWLDHADDPEYGFVGGTNVRVYRGRDYIQRLQRLRGETLTEVDPFGDSDSYFVLEAAGRSGETIRLVAALVRENEPFSSFVLFQNRATLGVSGAPRGLIHANQKIDFYFPLGNYVDSVTAAGGFGFMAGATAENTEVRDGNPEANPIRLDAVDFDDLKGKADLYIGEEGLDAEIRLHASGAVEIRPHTAPRYDKVEQSYTYRQYVGTETVTTTEQRQVQVGTTQVPYEEQVVDYYETETYTEPEQVQVGTASETYTETVRVQVGTTSETRYREVTVQTGTESVRKTREDPVYTEQTVTKHRSVKVWVPYDNGIGGGTSVGGGAETGTGPGEWQWIQEAYETTELVQTGTQTVEYWVDEPVYTTTQEPYTVTTPVYEDQEVERTRSVPVYEMRDVERTRQVPVYKTVTNVRDEPVYETQDVEVESTVPVYEDVVHTYTTYEYQRPTYLSRSTIPLGEDRSGTVYIDGRVTELQGDLLGRLTIVGNEKVRITGNVRYVDGNGRTAMTGGDDYAASYDRNKDYDGHSVLGVIARADVLFASSMPQVAEVNGTLMSVHGRVGVDGFWADATGELHKDSWRTRLEHLGEDGYLKEYAYDRVGDYRTRTFTKESLRRIGGVISNNRIMETYIKTGSDGYAYVDTGFKRGVMKFDINLLSNPPPNFVEVPRPVVTSYVPIVLVRD